MCEHTCYTHSRASTRRARSFVRIKPLILWCVFNVGEEKWHGITYGSWVPSNGGERCSPLSFFCFVHFFSYAIYRSTSSSLTPNAVLRFMSYSLVVHGSLVCIVFIRKLNETSVMYRNDEAVLWNVNDVNAHTNTQHTHTEARSF